MYNTFSLTCTRASVSLVLCASSSLVYTSGYCVLSKARSSSSSCSAVKVVLERLCFLLMGMPGSLSVSLSEMEPPPPAGEIDTSRSASVRWREQGGETPLSHGGEGSMAGTQHGYGAPWVFVLRCFRQRAWRQTLEQR